VDVPEVGFEAMAGGVGQRDEGLAVLSSVLDLSSTVAPRFLT
jgi:hypothetical protein